MGKATEALQKRQAGAAITSFMERSKQDMMALIPKHLNAERMLALFTYALKGNDKLLKCSPASIAQGVITAAGLGLELNGPLQQAFLVPRKTKGVLHSQMQIGYRGLVTLLMRSGLFTGVDAEAVYLDDVFEYEKGMKPILRHVPSLEEDRKEKPPVAFYACAFPVGGGVPTFKVMTLADIMEVRAQIPYWESGPWKTHPEAMAVKTVLIRLMKLLPLATDANKAVSEEQGREEQTLRAQVVEDATVEMPRDDTIDDHGEVREPTQETQTEPAGKPHKGRAAKKQEQPPVPEDMGGFDEVNDADLPDPGERVE